MGVGFDGGGHLPSQRPEVQKLMSVIIQRTIVLPDPQVHRFADVDDWHWAWADYPGIYVFVVAGECVYVGKSRCVGSRVAAHLWSPDGANVRCHRDMHTRIRRELAAGRLEVHCYACKNPDEAEGDAILAFSPTMNSSSEVGHGGCTVTRGVGGVKGEAVVGNVIVPGDERQIVRTVPAAKSDARGRRHVYEPLNEGEVRLLVGVCSGRAATGLRNRALIGVLWHGGIRLNQALRLRPADIDHDHGTVVITKGIRRRTVEIGRECMALLDAWMKVRAQHCGDDHPVFCTLKNGATIKTPYIRALLPRLAQRAGLDRQINAESLRYHKRHVRAA